MPELAYGAAEAHDDSHAQLHTPFSSPSTPADNLGGAAEYEPRPARRTVAVVAFGAAAALAYSAAPAGTADRLFGGSVAGFAAHTNPTSVPSNVAGPTSTLSIHAENDYEKASGRKLADGTTIYEHLVEMHKTTTLSVNSPMINCEYNWVIDGNTTDSLGNPLPVQMATGPAFNATFTSVGWHQVSVNSTCTGPMTQVFTNTYDVMCKYVRREIRSLSDGDRNRFLDALQLTYTMEKADGVAKYGPNFRTMEEMVSKHLEGAADRECDHWHDDAGIMTHHMAFTLEMEQGLQAIDPVLAVPYWDYTWDSYLTSYSANETGVANASDWTNSEIFSDDWFGPASPSNADHIIDTGRWGFTELAKDRGLHKLPIKNPYGLLRSPWNTNPVPYLTRYRYTYSQKDGGWTLPSCKSFAKYFQQSKLANFNYLLNGELHGPVHVMIGGQWEYNSGNSSVGGLYVNSSVRGFNITSTFGGEFLLSSKYLWRQGLLRCPEMCSDDTPAEECVCSCPSEITGTMLPKDVLQAFGITELTSAFSRWESLQDLFNCDTEEECYTALLNTVCHVGHAGEMFTSAAPYDPTFWILHGTAERYLSFKRYMKELGNTTLVETWGYKHGSRTYSDTVASDTNRVCDWSNVTGMELPTCVEATCPGHREDDIIPFGNFLGMGETYTNYEFYEFTNPSNDELPYTYDSFTYWPACTEIGASFEMGTHSSGDDGEDAAGR